MNQQNIFNNLRQMANNTLSLTFPQDYFVQYPWEIIDGLQVALESAYDAGDINEARKLAVAVDSMLAWRNSLVALGNVSNIPPLDDNNWWTDKYKL